MTETDKIREMVSYYRRAREIAWKAEAELLRTLTDVTPNRMQTALSIAKEAAAELKAISQP